MDDPAPRRPSRLRSVRARLVVGAAVLLTTAFAVAVVALREVLHLRVDDRIEQELAREAEELRLLAVAEDPATGSPAYVGPEALLTAFLERNVPSPSEAFYAFVDGRPLLSSFDAPTSVLDDPALVAAWTSAAQPYRDDLTSGGRDLRILVTPLIADDTTLVGTLVVAVDPEDELSEVDRNLGALVVVALLVTALGTVAAWTIAGRVLRPVHELTAAARATGAGELGRRAVAAGHDELAELGHTYNEMLDRLERTFRDQRSFLDDVAHELRTPITIVRGHLELLPDEPAQRAATLALVSGELERMTRYVDDLLTVARAGRPDFLRVELVDVADVLDGALERARAMATRSWERSPAPRAGELLTEADPDRLLQAMLALLTNAVQHTADGDRIVAGATPGPDSMALWVADHGPGVDPDDRDRLFERFSRGPVSTDRRPDGTGLGLAIVAAIAAAHGGRADVVDTPGGGATFRIHLPRRILEEPA